MNPEAGEILVVGGGVSGMQASLELAETGHDVMLVERAPYLGGLVSQLDHQFPSNHCGMCRMLPMLHRDSGEQSCLRKGLRHDRIHIRLSTDVTAVEGEPGNFRVSLRKAASCVDPIQCIGCGACVKVCPVETPDDFNAGLSMRKAIFQAAPFNMLNSYRIDPAACTRCGACVSACPTGAIHLTDADRGAFRILVVDDEQIVRDSTAEWLIEEGFAVEKAASGLQALDLLGRSSYHLMLLDIKMPGMDGVEVLKKAKDIAPGITVIMMTAYATVETAIEAMKSGAVEYLIKPFDPEMLLSMADKHYQAFVEAADEKITAGAIVLTGGAALYDPSGDPRNTLEYGVLPQVVTSLEFERMLSPAGPCKGLLLRADGKPVSRIAWIQCVGSRDLQLGADYCSSICCMISIKEALLAREVSGENLRADIFFTDMRVCGKGFHRYKELAESAGHIRFIRGRVHSAIPEAVSGDLQIRYVSLSGIEKEESYDLIVLAIGQRPHPDMPRLAERYGFSLNASGFAESLPFSPSETHRAGIFMAGSFSGLKDIRESVIQASAAAVNASRTMSVLSKSFPQHLDTKDIPPFPDVSREPSRVLAAICSCDAALDVCMDAASVVQRLRQDPAVQDVLFFNHLCAGQDRESLIQEIRQRHPNRLLTASCASCADIFQEVAVAAGMDPRLSVTADIRMPVLCAMSSSKALDTAAKMQQCADLMNSAISEGLVRVKHADAVKPSETAVTARALVAGAGIAGMTAALAIADHGYPVDVVERSDRVGGNLNWIHHTLDGHDVQPYLEEIRQKVESHPRIQVYTRAQVMGVWGEAGHFYTTVAGPDNSVMQFEHGSVILATGGAEASTSLYGHGTNPAVLTQKELETALHSDALASRELSSVVMIQCVGSREAPRNYCSRVCCQTAVKQALALKSQYPDVRIYVLYRDMMLYGFSESAYTRARREGVVFIPYSLDQKPEVVPAETGACVRVFDPVSDRRLEIETDIVVLATGIVPAFTSDDGDIFGVERDPDRFFMEADAKWRPVDAMKTGVFGCGIVNAPLTISETVASAQAAAMRALRILTRTTLASSRITAVVRHSLCSRCQLCIAACPYQARVLDTEADQIRVNAAMCQGCGACASICPNSAAVVEGFSMPQLFEMIDIAVQ